MAQENDWWKTGAPAADAAKPADEWWKQGVTPVDPKRSLTDYARDVAATAVKGAIGVPEAIVGLADIPTGGRVGKFLENEGGSLGFRPKEAKELVNDWHSDATKEAQRKFQEADGIGGKFMAAVENPSNIVTAVGESLPSIGLGGVAARGLMTATKLGQMGAKGAALAGAAGEGVTMAGSAAEQIRQETPDGLLTPGQSALAGATGLVGGALGAVGGRVAQKLGIGDVDTMIAQGSKGMADEAGAAAVRTAANPLVMQQAAKGIPRRVIEGAIAEGFLEELPQSVAEQVFQNVALGKDWLQDVDAAVVMGVLSGGVMGGAASGYHGMRQPQAGEDAQNVQPAGGQPPGAPAQPANPGMERIRQAMADQLAALQQQEQGEPAVTQTTPPDGAAILAQQQAAVAAQRQAAQDASRAVASSDDEIYQSTGATVPPSVHMGLDPAAGPLSAGAAIAVDTGVSGQMQQAAALAKASEQAAKNGKKQAETTQKQEQTTQAQQGVDPETGEISQAAPMSRWTDADLSSAFRGAQSREVRMQLAQELGRRRNQALQAELDAEQTGTVPGAERADAAFASLSEDAGPVPDDLSIPTTIKGNTDVPQADQAQQAAAQPAQAGPAQPAQGLTDAAPAEYPGAQGTPATGAQAAPEAETREQRSQRVASAGDAWTRMPTVERQALAQRADLKPIVQKNVHSAAWENLNGVIQRKLADAMDGRAEYGQNQAPEPTKQAPVAIKYEAADAKRQKAIQRVADGRGWFLSQDKANAFLSDSGLGDTHEVVQDQKRFVVQEKAARQDATPAPVADYWKNPKLNNHEHAGRADFKAGKPRTLPSYFTDPRGANAKAWFSGWDKAQADARQPDGSVAPAHAPTETAQEKPSADGSTIVGRRADGVMIRQDKNGVRFYTDGGTRISEAVEMRPTRSPNGGIVYAMARTELKPEFMTQAERDAVSPAPAAAPSENANSRPGVVNVPPAIEAAFDADMQAQKARITRLRNDARKDGTTLEEKTSAQTKLRAAETTLVKMRTTRFDAEDAAIKAIAEKDMAPFAEHIAFPRTEKALQALVSQAEVEGQSTSPAVNDFLAGRRDDAPTVDEVKAEAPAVDVQAAMAGAVSVDHLSKADLDKVADILGVGDAGAKPAKAAPTPAKTDALTEREKAAKAKKPSADQTRAKADLMNALADLGDILGKNTRMNIVPEQEQKLLPVLTRVLDAAFRLGYHKFKDSAKFALDQIRTHLGDDAADALTLDHLQGAYIAMAGGKQGADTKRAVIDVESKADIEAHEAAIATEKAETDNDTNAPGADATTKEPNSATTVPTGELPAERQERAGDDAAPGNGNRQSVDDGLAKAREGATGSGSVPAAADRAGGSRADGVQRAGEPAPGPARDSGAVRPEQRSADAVAHEADPATAESTPKPELDQPGDHTIEAADIGTGGLAKKYRDNIAAIRIIKAMGAESRVATPAERKAIARYVGWGALKGVFDKDNKQWGKEFAELRELLTDAEYKAARASTLNAHYTSPDVVGGIFQALERLGFRHGRMLEPSVGVGNFFGLMPAGMRKASQLHGVELDPLTSQIAAALYPSAKIAKATGFQDFEIPGGYFDVAIGNPPFGSEPIVDDARSPYSGASIHNYFFAKSIDKLRPGGLLAMVVSHNFLDAKADTTRRWIAERANLVAAVRLPNTAFKENAGTEVVTDIVVFQRKTESEQANGLGDDSWVKAGTQSLVEPKSGQSTDHSVSQYFLDNPAHVLGTPTAAGSMYRAGEYTVAPNGKLADQIKAWAEALPTGIYQAVERTHEPEAADVAVPDGVKVGSYFVDDTGKVQMRGSDALGKRTATGWTPPNAKAKERMIGMIGLRDGLRAQMRLERSPDATEAQIEAQRRELNVRYDAFRKAFGYLNDQTNRRIFLDDTESALLLALEFDYDRGVSNAVAEREDIEPRAPSATKADIFQRRVMFPPADNIKVSSARDALLASLNYKGALDLGYMAKLYEDKPQADILAELGDTVFNDPLLGHVMADEYLSGDVKTKLAEAESAALDNPVFKRNVAALKKVIPADKKPSEIHAALGAAFVPAEYFEQFAKEVTGAGATAIYLRATGQWIMNFTESPNPSLNVGKWGIAKMPAQSILQRSMAGQGVVVTETYRNADGGTTTVVLEKETTAAREKQAAMKAEWQRWLWSDPDRADKLAAIYNEKMNRIVPRKYDGSHMTFPGMSPAMELLEHQKNAVWRALQSRQVLLDHVVGAGKTFEIVALFMEMRRLGIARKPFIAVPNHLTLQWRSEFSRLYPAANVLAATPDDFAKGNREKFFSKIVTGDWDAVIVGHSSLKKIALPVETEKAILEEQVGEIAAAIEDMKRGRGDRNIVRDMEGIKARLEARMKQRLQALGERDKVVGFDDLGVDAFGIDELHEFKNLFYNSTMERVPGMGNPGGSDKAFDLFVKLQWMFDTYGEKAPIAGATGTPVSNSLVEMFNMQRFMQYPALKREGLNVFDAWAKQFGSVESLYEVSPSGTGYRQSSRFAKFKNLPALMAHYQTFADTVTLDDLKAQEAAIGKTYPVPKVAGGRPVNVVAKRSPQVAAFMGVPELDIQGGKVQFGFNGTDTVDIKESEKGGSYSVTATGEDADGNPITYALGQAKTPEDARLMVVEQALSPKIKVDPNSILGQFANLRQLTKETKGKVNALSLTGQANKAGLDFRLIDPAAPDFDGSKINLAVNRMMATYRKWAADKGAQLVFCDLSVPLSARSGFAGKERRVYVRDQGALVHKKGTMHTVPGHEQLPFFVVKEGSKDKKAFAVYDAATGLRLFGNMPAKGVATDWAAQTLADEGKRQRWIDARDALGDIEQDAIDDYNNENEIDTEETESITLADIAGVSGAQGFSVYDDIKAKLLARGVPEREIAFIHDYGTPIAKDKLFKQVKRGDVRFLLGSTPKMGAGTNVQDRLVGLHHIDAPWRPSDLEQREGRIIRRGNVLYQRDPDGFEVEIYRYATEQTYDTRRWQILEHKARGIEQLRNYDGTLNEIDDIEGEAANSADMKAAASGDPLILEETRLRNDVRRLESLQASHADESASLVRRARDNQRFAEDYGPKTLADLQSLKSKADAHPVHKDEFVGVAVGGKRYQDREAAIKAMSAAMNRVLTSDGTVETITYRGLEFTLEGDGKHMELNSPTGNLETTRPEKDTLPSAAGFLTRFANYVTRLPGHIAELQAKIAEATENAAQMREQASATFAQAPELHAAREAHKRVQRRLIAKGPDIPAAQRAQLKTAMEQQREALRAAGYGEALDEFMGGREEFAGVKPGTARVGTPTDRAIMDMAREGRTAQDILRFVASASKSRFNRQVARLLLKSGIAPAVRLEQTDLGSGDGFTFLAKYSRKHNALTLTPGAQAQAEHIVMHELMHAATLRALDRKGLASLQMRRLYEHVKRQGGAAGEYGMKNVGEFVAEAFTNPEFQRELRGINAPTGSTLKTAWDGFVRILRSILGLPQDAHDALSQALELGVAVMREDMALRQRGARGRGADAQAGIVADDDDIAHFGMADAGALKTSALDQLHRTLSHPGKVSLWDKTVGTMRHLGERAPIFKPVYQAAQRFIDDVSMLGNDAADRAPRLLPRVETLADLKKKPITAADNKAVGKPLFEGTLLWARDMDGTPVTTEKLNDKYRNATPDEKAQILLRTGKIQAQMLKVWRGLPVDQFNAIINNKFDSTILKPGVVWSAKELNELFGLNDQQVSLYQEARGAIDRSIDMTARADMLRMMGDDYASMREVVLEQASLQDAMALLTDTLQAEARENPDQADRLMKINNDVVKSYERAIALQEAGYAPLSRFGRYTVDVVSPDGTREYFGMFESMRDANLMAERMRGEFKGAAVTQGTMSDEAYKLFAGITPESLEQFGEMLGLKTDGDTAQDKAFQAYLQLSKNNHSALKRLIHRKGITGYSEDVGRVLASFVYSNARLAAGGLNAGTLEQAIQAIPKEQGELRDVAMGLRSYIQDPQEEGQAVRGMLFAQYLGGSVASAFVNMTQPFQITMPWLSQYGGMRKAAGQMARALKDMGTKGFKYEPDLEKALQDAVDDGTVSPQEIHQLMAQARGTGSLRAGDGTRMGDARAAVANNWERVKVAWGQPFALAEQFNRRSTFIAAYRTAKEQGMPAPAEFARRAVQETQFVYSKANKMRWGRGAIGGTMMTFKTYSVSYLELMHRMWSQGGPEGKRAVGWAVAMLLLMGGAGGLPFMEDAEDLIDGAGQLMGYNVSTKQWRKQLLRDTIGKELGNFVEQGVSGLPGAPIDVSGRLGMGNLVPGTGLLLSKQNRERDLMEVVGPAGDLVARGFTGARKALTGDLAGAALEVSPTAVRNAAKGLDMATSGIYKDTKGYKVIDTTLDEAIAKAIGFQPRSVAEVQESNSFMQRSKSFYIQTSSDIKAQWAQALFNKDDAALERVRERLADWNRDNPDQPIVVKMPDVWKRVREMGKDRTQRIADTAPKALRNQMREMARENG